MSRAEEVFLEDSAREFRSIKRAAEKAMAQVDDEAFFARLDPESNSVAVLVKHVGGNLQSRWSSFLTADGEKPDRRRDTEFELAPSDSRESLLGAWETGWKTLFETLAALGPDDILREVPIRGEPHTVVRAIHRSLAHVAHHVGQIVLLCKHAAGAAWATLSIPRGQSEQFRPRRPGPK